MCVRVAVFNLLSGGLLWTTLCGAVTAPILPTPSIATQAVEGDGRKKHEADALPQAGRHVGVEVLGQAMFAVHADESRPVAKVTTPAKGGDRPASLLDAGDTSAVASLTMDSRRGRVSDDLFSSSTLLIIVFVFLAVDVVIVIVYFKMYSTDAQPAQPAASDPPAPPPQKKTSIPKEPVIMASQDAPSAPSASSARKPSIPSNRGSLVDEYAQSSGLSETSEHFNQRLEEITQQLASMLKGPVQVSWEGSPASSTDSWHYVAAVPKRDSRGGESLWAKGMLGWWKSEDEFLRGVEPLDSILLRRVADVREKHGEELVVLELQTPEGDSSDAGSVAEPSEVILKFRAEKEAQLWANTLSALLEQLEDSD